MRNGRAEANRRFLLGLTVQHLDGHRTPRGRRTRPRILAEDRRVYRDKNCKVEHFHHQRQVAEGLMPSSRSIRQSPQSA